MKICWDSSLSTRALKLLSFLRPTSTIALRRIGSDYDGGYLVPLNLAKCGGAITAGIGTDNRFEFELGILGKKVLQLDPTITHPPEQHANLKFLRVGIGQNGISIFDALVEYQSIFGEELLDGILKLDIEGSEWDVLSEFSNSPRRDQLYRAFSTIVIELHYLTSIYKDSFWEQVEISLEGILKFYDVVAIRGNNCREIVQIGGVPVVDIVEVTFCRKVIGGVYPRVVDSSDFSRNIESRSPLFLSWPSD